MNYLEEVAKTIDVNVEEVVHKERIRIAKKTLKVKYESYLKEMAHKYWLTKEQLMKLKEDIGDDWMVHNLEELNLPIWFRGLKKQRDMIFAIALLNLLVKRKLYNTSVWDVIDVAERMFKKALKIPYTIDLEKPPM